MSHSLSTDMCSFLFPSGMKDEYLCIHYSHLEGPSKYSNRLGKIIVMADDETIPVCEQGMKERQQNAISGKKS